MVIMIIITIKIRRTGAIKIRLRIRKSMIMVRRTTIMHLPYKHTYAEIRFYEIE